MRVLTFSARKLQMPHHHPQKPIAHRHHRPFQLAKKMKIAMKL
jgi:hypothetical protein